ncbi:MAG: hypothetical protein O3B86_08600 [Planctomycetota bacterium]|nr:hypothetical protein [Planctomycetota bacterium]
MDQFIQEQFESTTLALFVFGSLLGLVLDAWSMRMCRQFCASPSGTTDDSRYQVPRRDTRLLVALLTGSLFAAY